MALLLRFAGQWVAGEKMEDALRVAGDANARGMDALVNYLGEHYREKGPVEATTREYLGLLNAMRAQGIRGTVSLKPTQFGVLINRALELAREHSTSFEFAMLQGVRDPLKRELVAQGHRVSEYIPYGPNWLPYFSRRLRERPKNIVTMVRSFLES